MYGDRLKLKKNNSKNPKTFPWEPVFMVFLFWYPLRHVYQGIDWWDTGYNYVNFEYAGLEHMDPMWFFSTYLANVIGHFMTGLPGGHTLAGMNLYTGLLVSLMALGGYFFCTRVLSMPKGIVFVGEFAAISLCWCPTALLYNYVTYVLFLACVILLYVGLTKEKRWLLFGAGVCLGTNVLVRFSNLSQAAMIVAVWAYAFLIWQKQHGRGTQGTVSADCEAKGGFAMAFRHTMWCLGGYLTALLVLLGYVFIRYGGETYVNSILRLFAMTENASDYKATSMLEGMIGAYVENLYWVLRMGFFAAVGTLGFLVLRLLIYGGRRLRRLGTDNAGGLGQTGCEEKSIAECILWKGAHLCAVLIAVVMVVWLYAKGFCATEYYSYGAMLWPGVTFLMLTMGIAAFRILHPKCSVEEKLISGMMILVILLTSLGSNNKVYPSMNNLFVAAPYTLWQCYRFMSCKKEWKDSFLFPIKAVLTAFLMVFLFQIGVFGWTFVFGEATGLQNITTAIENNQVLQGIKMSPERAEIMTEITAYVEMQKLKGKEVITYGKIPAISYYLGMVPAFNAWCDLDSYQYAFMEEALRQLSEEMETGQGECPVIILNNADVSYEDSDKFRLLKAFMGKYNYDLSYENDKFRLYLSSAEG